MVFYGRHAEFRKYLLQELEKDPLFRPFALSDYSREDFRRITFKQMIKIMEICKFNKDDYTYAKLNMAFLAINQFDSGLATRFTVHFLLYCKAIDALGTAKHHHYFRDGFQISDIGCFALTELRHGSNARGIQTRADYDHKNRQFIINTPDNQDMKVWIGAAGHLANMAVVWA